jgi:sulfatase modifying factor 1
MSSLVATPPEIFGRFVVLGVVDDDADYDADSDAGGAPVRDGTGPTTHVAVDLDRELRPLVALQRVSESQAARRPRRARIAWEAACAWHERITDEHVAAYVGHGVQDGVAWRAREWVDGVPLDAFLRHCLAASEPQPLPPSFVLSLAYILGSGLLELRHRPTDNVLVGLHPRARRVVLAPDGHVVFFGPTVHDDLPRGDERTMPSWTTFSPSENHESGCLASLVARLFTGTSLGDPEDERQAGPLGRVPPELQRTLARARAGEVSLRDLVLAVQSLMHAAGGGHYSNVASVVSERAAPLVSAAQAGHERLLALARRLRARRRPRAWPTLEHSARMLELRPRPASQEGPAVPPDVEAAAVAPADMVVVPGGRYLFHPFDAPEAAYVDVAPFVIDRHPVTCGAYAVFCRDTGTTPPAYWPLPLQWFPDPDNLSPTMRDAPVVAVTRDDAVRYAAWAGKRLPTEVEWELAARGFDGRLWPWGKEFDHRKAGSVWQEPRDERELPPVTALDPAAASPFGVAGIGLAWEWTSTPAPAPAATTPLWVIRGGAWRERSEPPTLMNRYFEDAAAPDVTFRCARDLSPVRPIATHRADVDADIDAEAEDPITTEGDVE